MMEYERIMPVGRGHYHVTIYYKSGKSKSATITDSVLIDRYNELKPDYQRGFKSVQKELRSLIFNKSK